MNRNPVLSTLQRHPKLIILSSSLLLLSSSIRAMSTNPVQPTTGSQSQQSKPAALIFLHGLGDTPAGWSSLESQLPSLQPSLSKLTCVFPPAPTIPITINGGMTMPGWFDLYDWPIGVGGKDDVDGLTAAVGTVVNAAVEKLEREKGIGRDRIVVGGFSQGGAVALLSAYSHVGATTDSGGEDFAGCVNLSGWVTLPKELQKTSTPLFWGHGRFDDKVLFEQQAYGVKRLKEELGVDVVSESYDVAHGSVPAEVRDMAAFLDRILFQSSDTSDESGDTGGVEER